MLTVSRRLFWILTFPNSLWKHERAGKKRKKLLQRCPSLKRGRQNPRGSSNLLVESLVTGTAGRNCATWATFVPPTPMLSGCDLAVHVDANSVPRAELCVRCSLVHLGCKKKKPSYVELEQLRRNNIVGRKRLEIEMRLTQILSRLDATVVKFTKNELGRKMHGARKSGASSVAGRAASSWRATQISLGGFVP